MSPPRPGDARPIASAARVAPLGWHPIVQLEWAPREADRLRILVDNPTELYGFGPVH